MAQDAASSDEPAAESASKTLDELVVTSKKAWIEGDHAVFMPSKSDKNLSNSPASLIKLMNVPILKANDSSITDIMGNDVKIFINGIEADDISISNFWPKIVKRVEYYSNPAQPEFKGYRAVVNFIVDDIGGIAKVNVNQRYPWAGNYKASSKLAYKDMTFGMLIGGDFTEDKWDNYDSTLYSDINYDNHFYNEIKNDSYDHTVFRTNGLNFAFNAMYSKNHFICIHTIGLVWNKIKQSDNYINSWEPDIFNSNIQDSYSNSNTLSPQVSGKYQKRFNDKFFLFGKWSYQYSSNNQSSTDKTGNLPAIFNSNKESINALNVRIEPSVRFSQQTRLTLILENTTDFYSIDYNGTYANNSKQVLGVFNATLHTSWKPRNYLQIVLSPGISTTYRNINNTGITTDVKPTAYLSLQYYPTSNLFINASSLYGIFPATASKANEVLIRESELRWFQGNPEFKSKQNLNADFALSWMFKNWLSPSISFSFNRIINNTYASYSAAPEDLGGILVKYKNADPEDLFGADLSLSGNILPRGALNYNVSLAWRQAVCRENSINTTINYITPSFSLGYRIKNFNFSVYYYGKDQMIADGGHLRVSKPDLWGFNCAYGNGDLYISLNINDIFKTRSLRPSDREFDNYKVHQIIDQVGRSFSLNISYTFGFGKKTDPYINIDAPETKLSGAASSH